MLIHDVLGKGGFISGNQRQIPPNPPFLKRDLMESAGLRKISADAPASSINTQAEGSINAGSNCYFIHNDLFVRRMRGFQETGTKNERFYPGGKEKITIGMGSEGLQAQRQIQMAICGI